ncbi:hypothetical protein A3731_08720 [Roseovarius sp. HI0049]|nr:hypothetical protein A3731_08720 [Roseovarius sp. HI0049]
MITRALCLAAIVAVSAVQAHAETAVEDADGNGSYSMDEMTAAFPELTEDQFVEIDTDASGDVSEEELAAAMESGVLAE